MDDERKDYMKILSRSQNGKINVDAIVKVFHIQISKEGFFYKNDKLKRLIKAV